MTIVRGQNAENWCSLFFKEANIFSLVAMENCEICLIDSKAFRSIALKHATFVPSLV